MSNTSNSSLRPLAEAFLAEIRKAASDSLHEVLQVSCDLKYMLNGIKRCKVQIECKAGCGWLIEACGEEADVLQQKAILIQKILQNSARGPVNPLSEIPLTVLPEYMIERQNEMSKSREESNSKALIKKSSNRGIYERSTEHMTSNIQTDQPEKNECREGR